MSEFKTIIQNIINDASPGELEPIFKDLLIISGANGKDTILNTIREYNKERGTIVHLNNGGRLVISNYNQYRNDEEDDEETKDKFIDYNNNGQIVKIDPVTLKGTILDDSTGIEPIAIDNGLKQYVEKNFPGVNSIAVYPYDNNQGKYIIYIISDKYNEANFWNGEWRSHYIVDMDQKIIEEGEISVDVHYYEDGNVRFQSNKKYTNDLNNDQPIVDVIKKWETDFTNELYKQFENLNQRQFKGLRRKLPVTRSKVNWGKSIGNYRLGRDAAAR